MAWIVENRRTAVVDRRPEPYLTDALKSHISGTYFPRYPTKRACLLPALHAVQHEYGWLPTQVLEEVGAFLDLAPAEVLDTASFYEEYWLKPKGKYLIAVCRSLSCEICGHEAITQRLQNKLGIELGETTSDGKFTLVEYECLGSCGTAPAALCNDVLHENITPESMEKLLDSLPDEPRHYKDPTVTWEEDHH